MALVRRLAGRMPTKLLLFRIEEITSYQVQAG